VDMENLMWGSSAKLKMRNEKEKMMISLSVFAE